MATIKKLIPIDEIISGTALRGQIEVVLDVSPVVPDPDPDVPKGKRLYVSPDGDNDRDGLTRATAKRTLQAAHNAAEQGTNIIALPGQYYQTVMISKPGVRIYAEKPGTAVLSGLWQEAFEGTLKWHHEGQGVYSAASNGNPFIGAYRPLGKMRHMLFRYSDRKTLESATVKTRKGTYKKPEYGFAKEGSRVYLRLPGRADPNGQSVELCRHFSQPLIHLDNAPNVTIDGLAIAGAGNADAIVSDRASNHLHLTNIVSTYNRRMAAVADNALVEWCDYSYPGMYAFVDDMIDLNGEGSGVVFDLVKNYYGSGGNAYLEGRDLRAGRGQKQQELRIPLQQHPPGLRWHAPRRVP